MTERLITLLEGKVRKLPSGALSLNHILVVVPTAQSGRRLRYALARKFKAIIPPEVRLPDQLLLDGADKLLATRTDEILAFYDALDAKERSLERAVFYSNLRRVLAEKALMFADVVEKAEEDEERWQELAELERKYLTALERRGKKDRIQAMKTPPKLPSGVEEVIRFDDFNDSAFGETKSGSELPRKQFVACGTVADEADKIAKYFASIDNKEELPALCVADAEMFPELVSAFEARGLKLHNPASTKLITSSLGHLVVQIAELIETGSYSVFSAFLRGGDVRRWVSGALNLSNEDMTQALIDLDNRQAELLPDKIDDIAPKTQKKLRAIFEFVKVQLRKKGVRELLESIFHDRMLADDDPSKEFAAAAEAINEILDEVEGIEDHVLRNQIFRIRLEESDYSLEPDQGDVIMTDGWLEVPFLEAHELVIAGFGEGNVPESVVGHPFLPDSLRHRLGLTDNERRTVRDRRIFSIAVSERADDSVRVYFHVVDRQGDVKKPSRLIFEVESDQELIGRVKAFYGARAGTEEQPTADLPPSWKLELPIPPEYKKVEKISPTALDSYLKCPFTYYLKQKSILGDKRMDDRAEELAAWEFGNLAHNALDEWAKSKLKNSTDEREIADFLEGRVEAQLAERFGTSVPAIVALQGESVKRRLRNFAAIQVDWRNAGWEIVATEQRLEVGRGHTLFSGKCDRVDFNKLLGKYCVIDYKTWDYAQEREESFQLPLYCAMADVNETPEFANAKLTNTIACYCVLGKTKEDVAFLEPMSATSVPEIEKKILEIIDRIEHGIFWPPASSGEKAPWRWDYEDWLYPIPEKSVSEEWIADQERRLDAYKLKNVV